MTDYKTVTVYTDGSCPNNPSEVGGIGIFNQDTGIGIGYRVEDEEMTNNRAEMLAIIMAIISEDAERLEILTDSEYVSKNLAENIQKWRGDGYKGIKNQDLWEILFDLTYGAINVRFVSITHIRRSSHGGNVAADALATAASANKDNYLWNYKKDFTAWFNTDPKKRHKQKSKEKVTPVPKAATTKTGTTKRFMPF